ncbi:MAG: response regulator [Nitrospirae bacterium]|nr:MAG: response regulator [Nitrospirota bacterium]
MHHPTRAGVAGKPLLIIGDDPDYCELFHEAARRHDDANETNIVHGIESALTFLKAAQTSPHLRLPHLILLNLKQENSRKFIRRFRADPGLASIPVVMMVSSDDPKDINTCYASGANGYVVAPDTLEGLVVLIANLYRHGLGQKQ